MEGLKQTVHRLTNHLQAVLGYLELEDYKKALRELRVALNELRGLAAVVSGLAVHPLPKDSVVVVPPGTITITADEMDLEAPPDVVIVLPIDRVRKKNKHNGKPKV